MCDVLLVGISEVLVAALLFSVIELAGLHGRVEGCFSFSDREGQSSFTVTNDAAFRSSRTSPMLPCLGAAFPGVA